MDTLLNDVDFAKAYLDNILMKSESQEHHAKLVKEVFWKIKWFYLKYSLNKCEFFSQNLSIWDRWLMQKAESQDPLRSNIIKNMPAPTNASALQAFLHYSGFISNMNILRSPLKKLLKKDSKWNCYTECQRAFEEIKKW